MDKFVVGFAFSRNRDSILLVRKLRPKWQRGLLNGIGGKIEDGEEPLHAMHRECKEETGLILEWIHRGSMQGTNNDDHNFVCYIFYAYSQNIFNYDQIEDELLRIYNPLNITPSQVVRNLKFLIPYGMYDDGSTFISLTY